jgi:transcriptional regulator with GAF, ATPase, and Fis domain
MVTVGAYMGGYHWTQIAVNRVLIYLFAMFAVFIPVANLHFFLVFPRPNPILVRRPGTVLSLLYGVPLAYLASLWASMSAAGWMSVAGRRAEAAAALNVVRWLALGYIGIALAIFGLCVVCLVSSYQRAESRSERNQVKWILLATLIAVVLIAYLISEAVFDLATLGRDRSIWPMFGVSLLYTIAYAFSITRYKLMQVEDIVNRSMIYFTFSVTAGLFYSAVLLVIGKLISDRFFSTNSTSRGALVAALSVIVVLILSEVARNRFQTAIDRRFFREKYKFDQAMQKMRMAVGSLVDRKTLGRRLLEAAAEVLRLEWGALYLADGPDDPLVLAASHGPNPDEQRLSPENPLVRRLRQSPSVRVSHAIALSGTSDAATDAMIALGGEAAAALGGDGHLAGLLVLGPKRSGLPYEDEEMAFLAALGSVATLALHSADIQRTLESLNQELRNKVEKIAEQQRRILVLQDQLVNRAERERERERDERETEELNPAAEPSDVSQTRGRGLFDQIKGSSPAVARMIAMARKVAASQSAVLIRGESGTGKELLAAAIHEASPRADRPFVKVHCAALSQNLLESELFGHVKGAFTGADRDRVGRFEQADGGTLFLDEIGDINLETQTKLLRVLQEMSFERVGSSQPIKVDVRLIAATHQDLEALIREGRFREDLFYRLNVIPMRTPPLRDRRDDVFELAVYFLDHHAERTGKTTVTHLDPEAVEALMAYDWPGNVRELENVIERAVVLTDGPAITRDDLPAEVREPGRTGFGSRRWTPARPPRRVSSPQSDSAFAPDSVSTADPNSGSGSEFSHPVPSGLSRGRRSAAGGAGRASTTGWDSTGSSQAGSSRFASSTAATEGNGSATLASAKRDQRSEHGPRSAASANGSAASPRRATERPSAEVGESWDAEFLEYERQRLMDAWNEANGNKSVAARILGMPRSTFFSKLKKHGLA